MTIKVKMTHLFPIRQQQTDYSYLDWNIDSRRMNPYYQFNKIMSSSFTLQNSFIVEQLWQKVNPHNNTQISLPKAKQFILKLHHQHTDLHPEQYRPSEPSLQQLSNIIHKYLLKHLQQKQLGTLGRQGTFLHEEQCLFAMGDCLQIWRWLQGDLTSSRARQSQQYQEGNQFQTDKELQPIEVRRVQWSSGKKVFGDLSLEQQQSVMKKSLEMVYLYKGQFNILFKHYSRFTIQNEHRRVSTFDDIPQALNNMTVNRFMLFCRDFDIMKMVEFRRKTEHHHQISKHILLTIFKRTAHLQRYMNLQAFMLALVSIAIKVHQDVDPRSMIHIQLLLNTLKVRYYNDFIRKLKSLDIKYSSTDFYRCYKDIIDKERHRRQASMGKITAFNNPHFNEQRLNKGGQAIGNDSIIQGYQSISVVRQDKPLKKDRSQQLGKRRGSVPVLPSISNNRYFKPVEHNNNRNTYSRYLHNIEDSSSVFKNRITGYSNINSLKSSQKRFHATQNPQAISKNTLTDLISDTRNRITGKRQESGLIQSNTSLAFSSSTNSHINNSQPYRTMQDGNTQRGQPQTIHEVPAQYQKMENASQMQQARSRVIGIPQEKETNKILRSLGEKVDLRDNDQLLKKHQQAELSYEQQIMPQTIQQ